MKVNSEKLDKLAKELNEVMGGQRGRVFNDLFVLQLRNASEDNRIAAYSQFEPLIDAQIDYFQNAYGLNPSDEEVLELNQRVDCLIKTLNLIKDNLPELRKILPQDHLDKVYAEIENLTVELKIML